MFYGKGPHDWVLNPSLETADHRQNIYSDKAYYFLTIGNKKEKESFCSRDFIRSNKSITKFDDFMFYEKETRNLFAIGTQWFGEDFSVNDSQSFKFDFKNVDANSPIQVKVRGGAISALNSTMNVVVNTQNAFSIVYPRVTNGSLTLGYANHNSSNINITSPTY